MESIPRTTVRTQGRTGRRTDGQAGGQTGRRADELQIENQAHSFIYGGEALCRETADTFRQIGLIDGDDL